MELEIINLIDEIEEQQYMAEMAVMDALMDAYMKEASMLEYCSEEVVQECFYQEGLMDDIKVGVGGVQGESVLKKILLFIPRLIASFVKWIQNTFFNKKPETTVAQAAQVAQSLDKPTTEIVDKVMEVADNMVAENRTEPTSAEKKEIEEVVNTVNAAVGEVLWKDGGREWGKTEGPADKPVTYSKSELNKYGHIHNIYGSTDTPIFDKYYKKAEKARQDWLKDHPGDENGARDKFLEITKLAREVAYLHTTSDEVIETIKSIASYKTKLYKRFQMTTVGKHGDEFWKNIHNMDTLKQMTLALKQGKIYTGIDLEQCKSYLIKWDTVLKKVEEAISEFDKQNIPKFDKNIKAAYEWADKNIPRLGGTHLGISHQSITSVHKTGGSMIPISEFDKYCADIRDQMKSIMDRCHLVWKRIDDKKDIKDFVDERRINNNDLYMGRLSKNRDKYDSGEISKDEFRENHKKLRDDWHNSGVSVMAKAFMNVSDLLSQVTSESRRAVIVLETVENECKGYLIAVQKIKGKKTKKNLKLAQKAPNTTKFDVNNTGYSGDYNVFT